MFYIDDLQKSYSKYGLPERFVMSLPTECPDCGAPLEMSENLTGLRCSNHKCVSKLVMRIRSICKDLNILNFGESTIEKFIKLYEPESPLDIFELKEGMILGEGISLEVSNKVISQIQEKNHFLLWEYVQVANIPCVRTSARKIFQGYETIEAAYIDIENGGSDFICRKLGINKKDETSIQAIKIYKNLLEFKDELISGEKDVNIVKLGETPELNVVCSDQVGEGFKNKPEFYDYVHKNFSGRVHVNFLSSATRNMDYLVWAGADGTPARYTGKVQKVEKWNSNGSRIPIVTGKQFVDILNEKY